MHKQAAQDVYHSCAGVDYRPARAEELASVAKLYVDAFPHQWRCLLGPWACREYLRSVNNSRGYQLIIADHARIIAGFLILHLDLTIRLSRAWVGRAVCAGIKQTLLHPSNLPEILARIKYLRDNRRSTNQTPHFVPATFAPKNTLPSAYIDFIGVDGSFRQKGIGRGLTQASFAVAKERGRSVLKLTVSTANLPAISFYQKLGFQPVAANPNSHSVIMQKSQICSTATRDGTM